MPEFVLVSIAFTLIYAGLFLLWTNWRKSSSSAWLKVVGWTLIALATPFGITAYGTELGIIFQLIAITLVAWTFIVINYDVKPIRVLPVKQITAKSSTNTNNNKKLLTGQVVAVVFIAPIVSLSIAQVFGSLLPMSLPSQLVVQALGFPVVWSLLAIWLCYTKKFWQLSGLLLILSLAYLWQTFG